MGLVVLDLGLDILHTVVRADEYDGAVSSLNFGMVTLGFPLAGGIWADGAFLREMDGAFSVAAFLEVEGVIFVVPCCKETALRTPPRALFAVRQCIKNLFGTNNTQNSS